MCLVIPCPLSQPAPNASPMKRSISTLAPRPHGTQLCNTVLDRPPPSQGSHHHHHRCHRRRDKKQRSLEKGPSLSVDTEGGAYTGSQEPHKCLWPAWDKVWWSIGPSSLVYHMGPESAHSKRGYESQFWGAGRAIGYLKHRVCRSRARGFCPAQDSTELTSLLLGQHQALL